MIRARDHLQYSEAIYVLPGDSALQQGIKFGTCRNFSGHSIDLQI